MTNPSKKPSWPLRDLRTEQRRAEDRPAVQRQGETLSPSSANPGTRADRGAGAEVDVVQVIRQRQISAGDKGLRFDVHPAGAGGIPALVVQNELVVEIDNQSLSGFGASLKDYEGTARP